MSIEGISINGTANRYVYDALEGEPKDLYNIVTNDELQNGTYNIVTPSMHIGTWRESVQEFGPATNRVVFDAIQPYTGTERIYFFDNEIAIFVIAFDSNGNQLGYQGFYTSVSFTNGYIQLSKIEILENASSYLLVFKFNDDRLIPDVSEIANKVLIINDFKQTEYANPTLKEQLVMLVPDNGYLISIYRKSGKIEICGNIYIYPKTGGFYNIPVLEKKTFLLTNGQTLVIDLTNIPLNSETESDRSSAIKIVSYSDYSDMCIPIANTRYRATTGITDTFVASSFTQFIVDETNAEFDTATLKLEEFKNAWYPFTMRNSGAGWSSRINLLHISDTHTGTTVAMNNFKEAIQVANSIYTDGAISAVIDTGDLSNGIGYSKNNILSEFSNWANAFSEVSTPYLLSLGNHDANNGTSDASIAPTKAEFWSYLFEPIKNKTPAIVWANSTNKERYCYYDITQGNHSVRVIMLDMVDHADYTGSNTNYECQWNTVYSQSQIDWLANTALDVPDGYGVIIANHFPFAPHRDAGYSEQYAALNDGYFVQSATGSAAGGWQMIPEIVQAWQNRTTISKTYVDTKGDQDIIANYDFSDVPTGAVFVCYLTGHTHSKNVYKVEEENGVSFDQLMLCEDSSGQNGVALNRVYKKFGTIADNAFSCLSIDLTEKKIYRTAYGVYKKCSDPTITQTQVFSFDFSN